MRKNIKCSISVLLFPLLFRIKTTPYLFLHITKGKMDGVGFVRFIQMKTRKVHTQTQNALILIYHTGCGSIFREHLAWLVIQ